MSYVAGVEAVNARWRPSARYTAKPSKWFRWFRRYRVVPYEHSVASRMLGSIVIRRD